MRVAIREFALANPIYRNAIVTFYTVVGNVRSNVLATLYQYGSGTQLAANPQKLRSDGRFKEDVYHEDDVIAVIEGISVASHETGIISVATQYLVSIAATQVVFKDAGPYATEISLQELLQGDRVTPKKVGYVSGDLYNALIAMAADGRPMYIPPGNYTLGTGNISINADIECDGVITLLPSIGANFAIILADGGYGNNRFVRGLKTFGGVPARTAGVNAIRVDCPNAHLQDSGSQQVNYGIVVRMYGVKLTSCFGEQCNTGLSAYARDTNHEINTLHINGGRYDSCVNCGVNIGDTSWPDAEAPGNPHGVSITIDGEFSADGVENRADNVFNLTIRNTYGETTNTDCIWRLGGSGDGNMRRVSISENNFKSANFAVKCMSAVQDLEVGPNTLISIAVNEVKLVSDIYGLKHRLGIYVGCFGNSQGPIGLAFRSLALASITADGFTLEADSIANGSFLGGELPAKWYPNTVVQKNQSTARNDASSSGGVYYTTPATGKAGTIAANVFTFGSLANSYLFNGGDRISTSIGGYTYIRSVDYVAGTALLDGGSAATGAATISQTAARIQTIAYGVAAPTTGTWTQGDITLNILATVGQPKSWICTVSGTPGTWVSEGNL